MTTETYKKKIDIFIFVSIFITFIPFIGWVILYSIDRYYLEEYDQVFITKSLLNSFPFTLISRLPIEVIAPFIFFLSMLSLVIAFVRVKKYKKTKHIGFIPIILLVTFESIFCFLFMGGAGPAILFVIIFVATSKYWR